MYSPGWYICSQINIMGAFMLPRSTVCESCKCGFVGLWNPTRDACLYLHQLDTFSFGKKRLHGDGRGINSESNRKIMESWWGGSCVGAVEQGFTSHRAARPESGWSAGECWPRWSSNFLSGVYVGFAPTERHPETQLLASMHSSEQSGDNDAVRPALIPGAPICASHVNL